jgi:pimeloyl-ACP methyl ester carboxylesterase
MLPELHEGAATAPACRLGAKELAERIPGSQLRLYPGEGHISILDNPIKKIVETLLDP